MVEVGVFEFVVRCRRCHEVIPPDEDNDTGFCRTPDCKPVDKTKLRCATCTTTHLENGKEVPGTMHCKDPKYEYLMSCSCLDYTAKEEK